MLASVNKVGAIIMKHYRAKPSAQLPEQACILLSDTA